MERWECCYVDFIRRELVTMTPDGIVEKRIKRDKSREEDSKENATARLIAQLGREGWEMTNGVWNVGPVLFFKRRLQE